MSPSVRRYLPARELIDSWLDGRRDPATVTRLRSSMSLADAVRIMCLSPAEGLSPESATLLEAIAGSDITPALRRILFAETQTPGSGEGIELLQQIARDTDPECLERRLALHLLCLHGNLQENSRPGDAEVDLAAAAQSSGDGFFRVLARLNRIDRLLSEGNFDDAAGLCQRTRLMSRNVDGGDLLEPVISFLQAEAAHGRDDPEALWTFLALRRDFRLLDHLRDRSSMRAAGILTDRNHSASALAIILDLAHRPPRSGMKEQRTELLLGLVEDLVAAGDVEFALQHINECLSILDAGNPDPASLARAHALRSILLCRSGQIADAAVANEKATRSSNDMRSKDPELLLLLHYARATLHDSQGQDEEVARLGTRVIAEVDRTREPGRWAAPLAILRVRSMKSLAGDRQDLLDAINDAVFLAAKSNDVNCLREGYFNLALTCATSRRTFMEAIDACDQAETLTHSNLDALRADRDMLFRLLPPDSVMRTVLSALIGRLIEDAERGIEDLFELSTTLVEQARQSHDLVQGLERSQRQVNRVLNSLPVIIWTSHGDTRGFASCHIDGALKEVFGRDAAEFQKDNTLWLTLIGDQDRNNVVDTLRAVETTLDGTTIQFNVPREDRVRRIEMRIMPLLGENHGDGSLYGIMMDVTERHELELSLRQTQKMDAVGRLAGGIAHDFNNVLSSILGASTLLAGSDLANESQRDLVSLIEKSALQGADITTRLREFSRRDNETPVAADVVAVARETAELAHHIVGKSVEVIYEGIEEPLSAVVTLPAVIQALINLILNAADAEPRDQRVVVGAHHPAPGRVALSVSDRGVGMDEEMRRHAFDPFVTSKNQRPGLGLTIVYRITRELGGEVFIESEPGEGTCVTLEFPEGPALSASDNEMPAIEPGREESAGRLLLIDDDETSREVVAIILESAGFEVSVAANGIEGVESFEEDPGGFDLVVTDIRMPRLDGFGVVRRIREGSNEPPILLMTGYVDEKPEEFAASWPNVDYIRKPFTARRFIRMVTGLLTDARSSRSQPRSNP